MVKAAINGFGRIGRTALRVFLQRPDLHDQIEFTAINTWDQWRLKGGRIL